jgi:gas vesicle protein
MTPIQSIEKKEFVQGSVNILFRLQELVCRINSQLSRLSQETQSRSQTMKKEYRLATDKSSKLTKDVGSLAPVITGGTLLAAGFCRYLTNDKLTPLLNYLSLDRMKVLEGFLEHAPGLVKSYGDLQTNSLQAEIFKAQSEKDMRNNEIQNESGKSGEARDLQSELQQLLANIRDLFKKASS